MGLYRAFVREVRSFISLCLFCTGWGNILCAVAFWAQGLIPLLLALLWAAASLYPLYWASRPDLGRYLGWRRRPDEG